MRKSSKEHKIDSVRREKAFQAELEDMIKGPPVETFSARMPFYTYTGLCPDPKLGTSPAVVSNCARDRLTYRGQYTFTEVRLANEKPAAAMKWANKSFNNYGQRCHLFTRIL